jgi:hypothetical protein
VRAAAAAAADATAAAEAAADVTDAVADAQTPAGADAAAQHSHPIRTEDVHDAHKDKERIASVCWWIDVEAHEQLSKLLFEMAREALHAHMRRQPTATAAVGGLAVSVVATAAINVSASPDASGL